MGYFGLIEMGCRGENFWSDTENGRQCMQAFVSGNSLIYLDIIVSLCTYADMKDLSIDFTYCKMHQNANGGKKQKIRLLVYQKVAEIL